MHASSRVGAVCVVLLVLLTCCGDDATQPEDVGGALRRMADDDPGRRAAAMQAVAETWPEGGRSVPILLSALEDEEGNVREAAAATLRALADRGADTIVAFLADDGDEDRRAFLSALTEVERLGAKVTPADGVDFVEHSPRAAYLFLIGMRSVADPAGRPWLGRDVVQYLADQAERQPERADREMAAAVASVMAASVLPPDASRKGHRDVLALLASGDAALEFVGTLLVDSLGAAGPDVVSALEELRTADDGVSGATADSVLRRFGVEAGDEPDVEELVGTLRSVDLRRNPGRARHWVPVAEDLGRAGTRASSAVTDLEAVLRWAAEEPQTDVMVAAAAALCRIDGPSDERVRLLLEGLERAGELVPRDQVFSFWPVAVALERCAAEAGLSTRRQIAQTLSLLFMARDDALGRPGLTEVVASLGEDGAPLIPVLTGRLKASLEKVASESPDDRLLRKYRAINVAARLIDALGGIGPAAQTAEPLLLAVVEGDDPLLRYHAARAMRRIR